MRTGDRRPSVAEALEGKQESGIGACECERMARPWNGRLGVFRYACLLAGCIAAFSTGCGRKEPAVDLPSQDILAVVNGKPITEQTFRYWWEKQPMVDTPKTRQMLLDKLVGRSSLAEAARAAGLGDDPVVAEQVESLLISRLKELELQPRVVAIKVSDDDISAIYESRKQTRYTAPERSQIAVLWFATRGVEPLVARYKPRLEQAKKAVLAEAGGVPASEGFGKLSIRNSEHAPSRYKGGGIGWLETAPHVDPWRAAVLEIAGELQAPGDLSKVVARDEGLFLVRLIERKPARIRDLAEVREAIVRELKAKQREVIEREFNERMQLGANVRRFPEHLASMSGLSTRASQPAKATRSQFAPELKQ
jgi:hypothetical protein